MSERRRNTEWPVFATIVAAVMLVALVAYGWAYVAMGEVWTMEHSRKRGYSAKWIAAMFEPAAKMESLLTGIPVEPWAGPVPQPTFLSPSGPSAKGS